MDHKIEDKFSINDLLSFPCTVTLYKDHYGAPGLSIDCMNSFGEYKINRGFSIPDVTRLLIKNQDQIIFRQFRQVDKIPDDYISNQYNIVGRDVYISDIFNYSLIGFRSLGYLINMLDNMFGYVSICNSNGKKETLLSRILTKDIDKKDFEIYDNDFLETECDDYNLLIENPLLVKEDNMKINFIHLYTSVYKQNYVWLTLYNKSSNDYVTCVVPSDIFKESLKKCGIFGYTIYGLDGTIELFINEEFNKFLNDYIIDGEVELDSKTRMIKFKYTNSNDIIESLLDDLQLQINS